MRPRVTVGRLLIRLGKFIESLAVMDGGKLEVTLDNEDDVISDYEDLILADFYDSEGAMFIDAFLAANLIGAASRAIADEMFKQDVANRIAVADGLTRQKAK